MVNTLETEALLHTYLGMRFEDPPDQRTRFESWPCRSFFPPIPILPILYTTYVLLPARYILLFCTDTSPPRSNKQSPTSKHPRLLQKESIPLLPAFPPGLPPGNHRQSHNRQYDQNAKEGKRPPVVRGVGGWLHGERDRKVYYRAADC